MDRWKIEIWWQNEYFPNFIHVREYIYVCVYIESSVDAKTIEALWEAALL